MTVDHTQIPDGPPLVYGKDYTLGEAVPPADYQLGPGVFVLPPDSPLLAPWAAENFAIPQRFVLGSDRKENALMTTTRSDFQVVADTETSTVFKAFGHRYRGGDPGADAPEEWDAVVAQAQDVHDAVENPAHYTAHASGVECIQITEHMGFCLGNAVKYVWRADLKHDDGGLEDLRKARWYLDREIARREQAA